MFKPITQNNLSTTRHMTQEDIAEEQILVERAKKNIRAFDGLYDKYFEGIFQFIYRRTEDEGLADDLCSQAFLKAMQNIKKYEFRGLPFSAWLYRIASNEVNKHFNKTKRKRLFSLEEERLKELLEESEESFSQDKVDFLTKTLKQMPTETIEILELRFFEDKSFKEIAFILNIGESGAKMRLYRAVDKLRAYFTVNWRE